MKKMILCLLAISSLSAFADIHCSGDVSVDINEARAEMRISSSRYNGTIRFGAGADGPVTYAGDASRGNIRAAEVNVQSGDVSITKGNGRSVDGLRVDCD